ncbi:MAG: HAMP domain-containing sensor histidine kinase [Acidobacteriota bacterium]
MRRFAKSHGDGSAFVAGLLLISLALVAVLSWQALDAAQSHRTVAEDVLRDYARLAADELIRRSLSDVGYGCYQLLNALSQARPDLPSHGALETSQDTATRRSAPLALYFFTLRSDAGTEPGEMRLTFSSQTQPDDRANTGGEPAPGDEVRAWLRTELKAPPPPVDGSSRPFFVRHALIDGAAHTFVVAESPDEAVPTLHGFELDPSTVSERLAHAFTRRPLLPASLSQGDGEGDLMRLTVHDLAGNERFSAGSAEHLQRDPYAPLLSVEVPYGERYQSIFAGSTVRVALYPEAVPRLIIGGLPRSRLPTLVGLLILTAGLLTAAIVQLRRSRELARLRSDFVSRVSHELRTPLTQIRMFAETLLLGRVRSDDERHRSLRIIDQEARRLSHLVENILQFSRSERDATRLTPEPLELVPLVRSLVRDFEPLVGARRVTFAIHPAEDAVVAVDGDAMRQILLNLLDNAVKYGPEEQQIRLAIEHGEDRNVRLRIEDQGPGIPARERQRIWQSFHRLERDRRSAVAGTGIGLAVVRELVALQGGRVSVEAGERGGACFVIELPSADSQDAADIPAGAPDAPTSGASETPVSGASETPVSGVLA